MLKQRLEENSIPEPNTGCTLWCAAVRNGYGALRVGDKTLYAHRVAWEIENGPIPAGAVVCHTCDVPLCINPKHLFIGKPVDNVTDMVSKGRNSRGSQHYRRRLTEEDVRLIRTLPGTLTSLAGRFGVAFQTISKVRAGKSWKHI